MILITGNKHKLEEYQDFLPQIQGKKLDLPEIQELDPDKVQNAKIEEGLKYLPGDFLIDDVCLYLDCLNNFPGTLIKWMLNSIGSQGLFDLVKKYDNYKAVVECRIGCVVNKDEIYHFNGLVRGRLVSPEVKSEWSGFGFDNIFKPENIDKTYAQMTKQEKNQYSHRGLALQKLKEFIKKIT